MILSNVLSSAVIFSGAIWYFKKYINGYVNHEYNSISYDSKQFKLFNIAIKMKKSGLEDAFIVGSVKTALEFEGVADLMNLWMLYRDFLTLMPCLEGQRY